MLETTHPFERPEGNITVFFKPKKKENISFVLELCVPQQYTLVRVGNNSNNILHFVTVILKIQMREGL